MSLRVRAPGHGSATTGSILFLLVFVFMHCARRVCVRVASVLCASRRVAASRVARKQCARLVARDLTRTASQAPKTFPLLVPGRKFKREGGFLVYDSAQQKWQNAYGYLFSDVFIWGVPKFVAAYRIGAVVCF